MSKLNRRDAEVTMGMISTFTVLNITTLEDFVDLMFCIEDFIDIADSDHIDYLSSLLNSISKL